MAVTMNSVNIGNNTNFKGSYSRTEQGNPYYKTSAGTTAGAVLALPAFLLNISKNDGNSKLAGNIYRWMGMPENTVREIEQVMDKEIKNHKKFMLPTAIIGAATALGSGMIVDHIRNNKAKEVADLTKQVGVRNAMIQGEGVAISQNGRTYYDSNVGSKYGAFLGAGCGIIACGLDFMEKKGSEIYKELEKIGIKNNNISTYVMIIGLFALGGWLMGKLTDHNTNKAATRKA